MTIRLRVRELARERGLSLSALQREARIPMSTARRMWYSTSDGKAGGPALKFIRLDILEEIADFFDVDPGALLKEET